MLLRRPDTTFKLAIKGHTRNIKRLAVGGFEKGEELSKKKRKRKRVRRLERRSGKEGRQRELRLAVSVMKRG